MDEAVLEECVTNDPNLNLPVHESETFIATLFDFMKQEGDYMNFADYVFLRKLNLAWKKCSIDLRLSKKQIGCAI